MKVLIIMKEVNNMGFGKLDQAKVNDILSQIGECMLGGLVETEALYYVIQDVIGFEHDILFFDIKNNNGALEIEKIGNKNATELALHVHKGGKVCDAKKISKNIQQKYNPRKVSSFIRIFMNSSRVQLMEDRRGKNKTWEMNGFNTHERPYIAGFERELS